MYEVPRDPSAKGGQHRKSSSHSSSSSTRYFNLGIDPENYCPRTFTSYLLRKCGFLCMLS